MQAARPALVFAVVLASPFISAHAVDFENPDAIPLVVEYEGTIFEVSEAPYAVGDRLVGRLIIDPRLEYFVAGNGSQAHYSSMAPSFVSGYWPDDGYDSLNRVFIGNELPGEGASAPIDRFIVADYYVEEGERFGNKSFTMDVSLHRFLESVSLDQNFEITSADLDEPDENMLGRIVFGEGATSFLHFAIDRLSVRPGRCSAP